MSVDYFSIESATSISTLKKGARIHVLGICGVAMAQIAIALHRLGFVLSGSDKEYYEPMKGLLESSSIKLYHGYSASNLDKNVDLVVIGNSISSGNEELCEVENKGLSYTFFPKLLNESVIRDNRSIVITGTHGKTTSSALAASVLVHAKKDPSFFVGGAAKGLVSGLEIGKGNFSVVEGDEYDSAFFAKVPKFFFYRADALVVTSLEFDHADIYPDLAAIEDVFLENVKKMPDGGTIAACIDCPNVARVVQSWRERTRAKIVTYGVSDSADVRIVDRKYDGLIQKIEILDLEQRIVLEAPLFGLHNARNVLGVYVALKSQGLDLGEIRSGLLEYKGVRRRQDIRVINKGIVVIEDFAHHPTAVRETLLAIREAYPKNRLLVAFEPRSNSSRRRVFQSDYISAFGGAQSVFLCEVAHRPGDEKLDLLNVSDLAKAINDTGVESLALGNPNEILEKLSGTAKKGDVIVVMSNGSFGGLIDKLVEVFSS